MAKRVDDNQKAIVKLFRELGASVQILSDVGKGCPDIVVGAIGRNYLFEIKNPLRNLSGQKLTDWEQIFFNTWQGHVEIIKTQDDVIAFMNKIRTNG